MAGISETGREKHWDELFLLREMHHRMANTLTALASDVRVGFSTVRSCEVNRAVARIEARIVAYGNLHRALLVGARRDRIAIDDYVEYLGTALSHAVLKPLGLRCEVQAVSGSVDSARCELLGLIITELVTNAAKYAFADRDTGTVRITISRSVDAWLCTVSDDGAGKCPWIPGAGSKIVKGLLDTLNGSYVASSGRNGTRVLVTCPADDVA